MLAAGSSRVSIFSVNGPRGGFGRRKPEASASKSDAAQRRAVEFGRDEGQFVAVERERAPRRSRRDWAGSSASRRPASRRGRAKCRGRPRRSGNPAGGSRQGERADRPMCAWAPSLSSDDVFRALRARRRFGAPRRRTPRAPGFRPSPEPIARRGGKRQTVPKQGLLEVRLRRNAAGEDHRGRRRGAAGAGSRRARAARRACGRSPAPDRRRSTGQGASRSSDVDQQRIVRAGEHDAIGAPAVLLDEAGRHLGGDFGLVDRLSAHRGFGDRRETRRSDQRHLAIGRVVADQRLRIVARHRAARREHADQPRTGGVGRRLDRRHHADEGQIRIARPQARQRERRGGRAGDDDDVGAIGRERFRPSRPRPAPPAPSR